MDCGTSEAQRCNVREGFALYHINNTIGVPARSGQYLPGQIVKPRRATRTRLLIPVLGARPHRDQKNPRLTCQFLIISSLPLLGAHFRSGIVLNTSVRNLPERPTLACESDREVVMIVVAEHGRIESSYGLERIEVAEQRAAGKHLHREAGAPAPSPR